MKQLLFVWLMAILAVGMSSCTKETLTISAEELFKLDGSVNVFCAGKTSTSLNKIPQAAQDYLQKNFSDFTVHDVYVFTQDSSLFYGVELKKLGLEKKILFNSKGEVVSVGDDNERSEYYLADKIPASIKTYLREKFPNVSIKEVELKHEYGLAAFKIELSNDVKIIFSQTGEMWCQGRSSDDDSNDDDSDDDDDDDKDDDSDDNSNGNSGNNGGGNSGGSDDNSNGSSGNNSTVNVSTTIKNLVASKYPGYTIYEVEKEDWCDDQYLIEVGIKNGSKELHLVFDLNEKFLFEYKEISEAQLPSAVANAIKTQFAGYKVKDDDDVEELTYADGSKRYYVRLRKSSGGGSSDVRVMFTADGKVFCQKK